MRNISLLFFASDKQSLDYDGKPKKRSSTKVSLQQWSLQKLGVRKKVAVVLKILVGGPETTKGLKK